jgi:AraC-like DNA-binding protein
MLQVCSQGGDFKDDGHFGEGQVFHPQIGLALKSMHENAGAPWTVESLAAACGMSRSAFAQKFKDLVGEAPLEYLTNWRMQKAIALLLDKFASLTHLC